MNAIYYGTAPIALNSKIRVRRGVFDSSGTLIISDMECLDTGIIWRGTMTPPGWRSISPPVEIDKFYIVQDAQINSVQSKTVFTIEEISDPKTNR